MAQALCCAPTRKVIDHVYQELMLNTYWLVQESATHTSVRACDTEPLRVYAAEGIWMTTLICTANPPKHHIMRIVSA
jgi:hypothetical protein